jgi:hypothetical protein
MRSGGVGNRIAVGAPLGVEYYMASAVDKNISNIHYIE